MVNPTLFLSSPYGIWLKNNNPVYYQILSQFLKDIEKKGYVINIVSNFSIYFKGSFIAKIIVVSKKSPQLQIIISGKFGKKLLRSILFNQISSSFSLNANLYPVTKQNYVNIKPNLLTGLPILNSIL